MKLLALFLGAAAALQAALPPLAQSAREINALVSDPHLQELLGSPESIETIVRTEEGYALMTPHYLLRVDVHYLEGKIGPVPFEFTFHIPEQLF
jgi:hypothetical protein